MPIYDIHAWYKRYPNKNLRTDERILSVISIFWSNGHIQIRFHKLREAIRRITNKNKTQQNKSIVFFFWKSIINKALY